MILIFLNCNIYYISIHGTRLLSFNSQKEKITAKNNFAKMINSILDNCYLNICCIYQTTVTYRNYQDEHLKTYLKGLEVIIKILRKYKCTIIIRIRVVYIND